VSIAELLKRGERCGVGVQLGTQPKAERGIAFVRVRGRGHTVTAEGPYHGDFDSYEEPLQRALDEWREWAAGGSQ